MTAEIHSLEQSIESLYRTAMDLARQRDAVKATALRLMLENSELVKALEELTEYLGEGDPADDCEQHRLRQARAALAKIRAAQ